MAKKIAKSEKEMLASLAAKVTSIKAKEEDGKTVSKEERTSVRDALGRFLGTLTDPDMKKRTRRQLRRLGFYISEDGKPWAKAPKATKAKAKGNAPVADAPAAPADVTEPSNA